jgi:hypothetical protein
MGLYRVLTRYGLAAVCQRNVFDVPLCDCQRVVIRYFFNGPPLHTIGSDCVATRAPVQPISIDFQVVHRSDEEMTKNIVLYGVATAWRKGHPIPNGPQNLLCRGES